MHLKVSSGKWRPFCLGLNVLICIFENVKYKMTDSLHREDELSYLCVAPEELGVSPVNSFSLGPFKLSTASVAYISKYHPYWVNLFFLIRVKYFIFKYVNIIITCTKP